MCLLGDSRVISLKFHFCVARAFPIKGNENIQFPIYRNDLKAVILESLGSGAARASPGDVLKRQILSPYPGPTKSEMGLGREMHGLTSSPGDPDARGSLRTTALEQGMDGVF